ncbi:hypothetical protein [Sphingopyxis sp.]|uniref:hypothetical protein n=1 Tax=Sphingopyxis sp. TaxID=1908224 RepID=UPI001DF60829|nr:hypothetical protein [Sphingopyxis sp.]MBW8294347.1 hypothetical protein [Sphingopyxis sp.]
MNIIKATLGWFLRKGMLFVLIVAAISFHQLVWPRISDGIVKTAANLEWKSPGEIKSELMLLKQQAISELKASEANLADLSGRALDDALRERKNALARLKKDLDRAPGLFERYRPTVIIAREKLQLRSRRLTAEIALLTAVKKREEGRATLAGISYPFQSDVSFAQAECIRANKAVRSFNSSGYAERSVGNILHDRATKLTQEAKVKCGNFNSKKSARETGIAAGHIARAQLRASEVALSQVRNGLAKELATYAPEIADETYSGIISKALLVLAAVLAMPFIIRVIFYYVLAPMAERRASVRIKVAGNTNVPITASATSGVSIPVTLGRGEELLVRQDYLQSSALGAKKDTRAVLDYRHVLSSIASGLIFLTRIRGEGETTTVSAVRDPFAELAEIRLPAGAACVLHQRALVAVVQPIAQAIRITSHWRLFSLNAWLTLQLRYLVFHGSCRLIVKGGRGIRVEQAERGRIFGQDQLVGFSTDLAYSVTRTETFAPYFFGREQLLKDKIEQGSGILIIEEAPLSSRRGNGVGGRLEGVFDAGLKVFGL